MTPKFSIGDRVNVPFVGELEGVRVEIMKPLAVSGITIDAQFRGIRFVYTLHSQLTLAVGSSGIKYNYTEAEMEQFQRLEPILAAIAVHQQ